MELYNHLDLLGKKVVDRVTGVKGVATSVSFDLYGCIQAVVNPGLKADGSLGESNWFDVARLKVTSKRPVMNKPNFISGPVALGRSGAAEKPKFKKV